MYQYDNEILQEFECYLPIKCNDVFIVNTRNLSQLNHQSIFDKKSIYIRCFFGNYLKTKIFIMLTKDQEFKYFKFHLYPCTKIESKEEFNSKLKCFCRNYSTNFNNLNFTGKYFHSKISKLRFLKNENKFRIDFYAANSTKDEDSVVKNDAQLKRVKKDLIKSLGHFFDTPNKTTIMIYYLYITCSIITTIIFFIIVKILLKINIKKINLNSTNASRKYSKKSKTMSGMSQRSAGVLSVHRVSPINFFESLNDKQSFGNTNMQRIFTYIAHNADINNLSPEIKQNVLKIKSLIPKKRKSNN